MRIIAGDFKGRRLKTPIDNSIRPTSDKVKESVFNMLQEQMEDAIVLDLFCGSGNLGLEALSRGAKHCYFCDSSKDAIELTRENVSACGATEKATLKKGDYKKNLYSLEQKIDVIFLDPPYNKGLLEECFAILREKDLLKDKGVIVAEHSKEEKLPEIFKGYEKIKEKKYGIIVVSIYS